MSEPIAQAVVRATRDALVVMDHEGRITELQRAPAMTAQSSRGHPEGSVP